MFVFLSVGPLRFNFFRSPIQIVGDLYSDLCVLLFVCHSDLFFDVISAVIIEDPSYAVGNGQRRDLSRFFLLPVIGTVPKMFFFPT